MNFPRRFIFRGNACGLAAHIRRPENKILPVQAASSLPVTGGVSESKAGPGGLGYYLHYNSAETSAHGDFVDEKAAVAMTNGTVAFDAVPTKTTVTARVRGLHVGKHLSIGAADAGLVSESPQKGSTQPSIKLVGNRLEGVKVDGYELKITLNEKLFCDCDTMEKLTAAYSKLPAAHTAMFCNPTGKGVSPTLPAAQGIVVCTIVEKMEWATERHPDFEPEGNLLVIPDFGKVYFGELLITDVSRRLTMVRLQLGSPDGGDASASEVESNGSTWPPT